MGGEVHPFVSGKIKRSVKPKLEFKVERRGWFSLAFGWLAFLLGGIPAFATMILRFLFPNVLFEPHNPLRLAIQTITRLVPSMRPTRKNTVSGLGELTNTFMC